MLRSTRSAHTARITDDRFTTIRAMGFALASITLIAAATACGSEIKEPKDLAVDSSGSSTTPAATVGTDTSGGAVTPSVAVPQVSLSDAELAYHDKRYDEATKLFSTYADQHPANPWGHYMLGLSAWKSGDLDLAENAFGLGW